MGHSTDSEPKASFVGMHTMQRVGRSLRAARRQAGLTQAETAAQAGVSRESLSLIENGRRGVQIETLNAVLDVLGYKIAFLPRSAREQQARDRARSYPVLGSLPR